MLQQSLVDEEDGSSCRRGSNLIRNLVLSFSAFSPFHSSSSTWPASSLGLAICLVAILVVTLAPILCGSGSAKRAIGSHDIRGEVDALVEDSWKSSLEFVESAGELADGGCGRRSANFGYGNSDGLAFAEHEVFGDTSESGGEIVSGETQRDG
jgi:hypothetical protein